MTQLFEGHLQYPQPEQLTKWTSGCVSKNNPHFTPRKINSLNLKMMVWFRGFPDFQWCILRFHVNLSGVVTYNVARVRKHFKVSFPGCFNKKRVSFGIKKHSFARQIWGYLILLMVQKSVDHQLRLVVYPFVYQGFSTIPSGDRRISEPSTVSFTLGPRDGSW